MNDGWRERLDRDLRKRTGKCGGLVAVSTTDLETALEYIQELEENKAALCLGAPQEQPPVHSPTA